MKYTGAEIIIKLLEKYHIEYIAGIPGGANLPLYNTLSKSRIKHILARHEQGAGFIAHGIARSKGIPGVCFTTSGPGVMNLLTAVADAYLDSVPLIAITGQVELPLIGTDAFQEIDAYGLTIPITKHNFLARNAGELLKIIPDAFRIALSGRQGPVLIDVPKNVQKEIHEVYEWPDFALNSHTDIDSSGIKAIADLINESKRPVICVGGGVIASGSSQLIREFVKRNSIPVVSTLMGLGSFSYYDPLYMGMIGMHGAKYSNTIIRDADLFMAFGVRFDDRVTGEAKNFCPDAKIIHVDIDASEINKIKKSSYSLNNDIKAVLQSLIPLVKPRDRQDWNNHILEIKNRHPRKGYRDPFHPVNLIKYISSVVDPHAIVTTDVGQHQMWTAQSYPFQYPRTFLTSGGLGTMGFGLPAAIGASLANPDKPVICISGDGSILMNIQELATLADYNLPVKIIILNNNHLGMIHQHQKMFYGGNIFASRFIKNPDFASLSREFNIPGMNFTNNEPFDNLKKELLKEGPCIIDIPINHEYDVLPIVPPGAGNHEMIEVFEGRDNIIDLYGIEELEKNRGELYEEYHN